MTASSISPAYPIFSGTDGQPLNAGYIYVGTAGADPQSAPKTVYWDAALTIPAAQPVRTLNGYPSNSGSPGMLYVDGDYSLRVLSSTSTLVYTAPNITARVGDVILPAVDSGDVNYKPTFLYGVTRSQEQKNEDVRSVKDYGVVGGGSVDDTASFTFAYSNGAKYIPPGTYRVTGNVSGTFISLGGVTIVGGGKISITEADDMDFSGMAAATTPLADADLFAVNQNGVTKKTTIGVMRTELGSAAAASAAAAAVSATAAQTAQAASWVNNRIYADTTAGLAATTNGQYFCVPANDGQTYMTLYLNNSGSAVSKGKYMDAVAVYAAMAKLQAITDVYLMADYVGAATPAAGASTFASASTIIFQAIAPREGRAYGFQFGAATSGTIKIKRFTRSGNVLTQQSEVSYAVTSGLNTVTPDLFAGFSVSAGDYIGIYIPAGVGKYTASATEYTPYFSIAGDISSYTFGSAPNTSNRVEFKLSIHGRYKSLQTVFKDSQKVNAVEYDRGQTITLGAASPATKTTYLGNTATFFGRSSAPESGVLESWAIWADVAANAMLKIATPANGSYSVYYSQLVPLAVGLNTFSVTAGTLPLMTIPKGAIFGLCPTASNSVPYDNITSGDGYYSITGTDVVGTLGALSQAYGRQIQMNVSVVCPDMVRKIEENTPRYPIYLSFASAIPSAAKTAGMSYSGGYAVNSTTGISTAYAEALASTNVSRGQSTYFVQGRSADARIAFYKRPVLNLSGVDAGTCAEIDFSTNQIKLYNSWAGSALPSVNTTQAAGFTFVQNRTYVLKLASNRKAITASVTDTVTGQTSTISISNTTNNGGAVGFCYGAPGVAVLAGTGAVALIRYANTVRDPKVLMLGDSITECSGATSDGLGYSSILTDALGGLACVSADGGTASDAMMRRLQEALPRMPSLRYVFIAIGTGDASSGSSGVTAWQTNVSEAVALCGRFGVVPVVFHIPPRNDANQTHVDTMNAYIRSAGWFTVRNDLALSVGNDGSTYNAALMADGVHPNDAGHAAMAARVQLDMMQVFE